MSKSTISTFELFALIPKGATAFIELIGAREIASIQNEYGPKSHPQRLFWVLGDYEGGVRAFDVFQRVTVNRPGTFFLYGTGIDLGHLY